METVQLEKLNHRGEIRIAVRFAKNNELHTLIRNVEGAIWSRTHGTWHIPYAANAYKKLKTVFNGKATIIKLIPQPEKPVVTISTEALVKVKQYQNWLASRRYSNSTIDLYTDALKTFLKFYHTKPITEITNDDVIRFNNEYVLANKLSASFQNQVVNAIKLFFKTVENKGINVDIIHRPKRSHVLPNVLSKEDVKKILEVHTNFKHRVMLSLIYACGLRRSELLNLKPNDIDGKRHVLIIKQAKGRKDRIAPISDKTINLLREYYKTYKPTAWLFEGQKKGEQYTAESLQNVLKQALAKAKIKKPVTLHWLRHSYATHLLESGTDLRYIQELLGHKSSRTTEIYTHVSTKSIQKIKSPFDDL